MSETRTFWDATVIGSPLFLIPMRASELGDWQKLIDDPGGF